MPKLSIIIPVYNASAYLEQTLGSVLNQSLKDIEVICVDDGSTDSSLEILRRYAQKDARVKVLQQKNLYAGVARNAGLAIATGEYAHFLDADDFVLNYAYEAIYNKAVKYDLDCLKFASLAYDMSQGITVEQPAYTLTRLRPGDFNRLLSLEAGSPLYKINVALGMESTAARFSMITTFDSAPCFVSMIALSIVRSLPMQLISWSRRIGWSCTASICLNPW